LVPGRNQRLEDFREAGPIVLELLKNGAHEVSVGSEGMAAAIESGLDAEFPDLNAFFGDELALDQARPVIGNLQYDALFRGPVRRAVEIRKVFHVPVQGGIDAGGKDDVRTDLGS